MGAATSQNVTDQTLQAISEVSSELINNVNVNSSQNQIISVNNVVGDVDIGGNKLEVIASVNMQALSALMATTSVQQELANKLEQKAKALIKDINLGNLSDADNKVKAYVKEAVKITNNLTQTCSSQLSSTQQILVDHAGGNVTVNNNTIHSFQQIYANCVAQAVNNNSAFQQLQSLIDQSAESKTIGFSIWGLAAIAAIVVLGIGLVILGPALLPALMSGGKAGILVGLIFMLIGAVLLLVWWFWSKRAAKTSLWSNPLEQSCSVTRLRDITGQTSSSAQAACINDKKCEGFYIPSTSSTTTATLFSSVNSGCSLSQNNAPILINRTVFAGAGLPGNISAATTGDVYINQAIGTISELQPSGLWGAAQQLVQGSISQITGVAVQQITARQLRSDGWQLETTPEQTKYTLTFGNIVNTVQGLWQKANPGSPSAAGIVFKQRKRWLLWTGVGFAAAGVLMMAVSGIRQAAKGGSKSKSKAVATASNTTSTSTPATPTV